MRAPSRPVAGDERHENKPPATRDERRKEQALTFLIMHALERSRAEGFAYFDFGTSSVNMVPRENVFRFKEAFSRTAVFRETFEWRAG